MASKKRDTKKLMMIARSLSKGGRAHRKVGRMAETTGQSAKPGERAKRKKVAQRYAVGTREHNSANFKRRPKPMDKNRRKRMRNSLAKYS